MVTDQVHSNQALIMKLHSDKFFSAEHSKAYQILNPSSSVSTSEDKLSFQRRQEVVAIFDESPLDLRF